MKFSEPQPESARLLRTANIVSHRVDFSANARIYDRRHGAILPMDVVERLAAAAAIRTDTRILDIGAGTGRVAIAFAEFGCNVVALEPSMGMMEALRTNAGALPVRVIASEGARLPFTAETFDAVVLARLLYLTKDWPDILREAHRVLRRDAILLHEWGNGYHDEEWVQVREKARELFEEAGVVSPFHPGARSENEIDDYLKVLGFVRTHELATGPGPALTLADLLRRLESGEFSWTWSVPITVQETCLPRLKEWTDKTFDLAQPVPMPREVRWTLYRKTAG